ncbi:peptidylprolyl isomerase [Pseudoduganella violaceinigra]|uniref:peptidylprolyl isomerase n=1 Tax=Pseudoduganella violaceinigra TaxID=246602 RepID=UPI0003F9696C|nr:peptidylprolyl isomerase [Pseudoduganella violaceinigra]
MLKKWIALLAGLLIGSTVAAAENPQVSIKTNLGEIIVELDQEKAPISTANFLAYVKSDFYKDTIFHRVINGFMVQAGGYTADLKSKQPLRPTIKSEEKNGLSNLAYTISMARHDSPDSGQSQWFINVVDNIGLDYPNAKGHGYTVFGKVIQGKETVDKIKVLLVDDKPGFQNIPVHPVVIKSATVLKKRIVVPEPVAPAPAAAPAPAPEPAPAQEPAPAPQPEPVK